MGHLPGSARHLAAYVKGPGAAQCKHWSLEEELAGRQFPTQVGLALGELGVQVIVARSPQAKGRIERTWRTFQDRLTSELRLAQVSTLEQAQAALALFPTEYNVQFGRKPKAPAAVWRKFESRLDQNYIFSLRLL